MSGFTRPFTNRMNGRFYFAMRVIIACERFAVVRDAFLALGHDAHSCDLVASESPTQERHFQCDIFELLKKNKLGSHGCPSGLHFSDLLG